MMITDLVDDALVVAICHGLPASKQLDSGPGIFDSE